MASDLEGGVVGLGTEDEGSLSSCFSLERLVSPPASLGGS